MLHNADDQLSAKIALRLSEKLGPHKYQMWFEHSARIVISGARLTVATDTQFVADWIISHFNSDLDDAATEVLGREAIVTVRVEPELTGTGNGHAVDGRAARTRGTTNGRMNGHANGTAPVRLISGLRPTGASHRRLEDFIVGPCNRLAYLAALQFAEETSPITSGGASLLFVHGPCGVGKSHLVQGICARFAATASRSVNVRYVTGEQFTNEYITAVRASELDAFRRRSRKLDLLVIDDVHFLSNKVATQSEFMHTIDAIDLSGARVALASDEHPRQIRSFSQALVSRFLSGMVVSLQTPALETRTELIRRMAGARGMKISPASIEALAAGCIGSVREIEGALSKLTALRSLSGQDERGEIGLSLVQAVMNDQAWRPRVPVRIETIVDVVCSRLAVNPADLRTRNRHRRVVLARGIIAHLARCLTTKSYPEIALSMGRRYHSTIHTAAARTQKLLLDDIVTEMTPDSRPIRLRELVDQIRQIIMRSACAA